MSERRPTEPLLRDLVGDLRPVTPIPRLSAVAIATLGAWAVVLVAYWTLGWPRPLGRDAALWSDPAFVAVLIGLALTAAGALAAALCSAVPGRGAAARVGRALVLGALTLSVGGALAYSGGAGTSMSLEACVFLGRGVAPSPLRSAGLAALGAVALGAFAVHAGCAYSDALHMLLGHALAPVAAALVGSLPLALVVRASLRRSASA
jgi:hypothetical protein